MDKLKQKQRTPFQIINMKKIIIISMAIGVVLSIYFTAYLPLAKSRRYISSILGSQEIQSLEDFYNNYNQSLEFYSPTGQEEAVRFTANDMLHAVANEVQQESFDREIVSYIEPYLFEDNVRHLLIGAQLYFVLWKKYNHQEADFSKAEYYYAKTLLLGPKLPPALYGLFDLYNEAGEREKQKLVGTRILELWDDNYIRSKTESL